MHGRFTWVMIICRYVCNEIGERDKFAPDRPTYVVVATSKVERRTL